jgi:hypothetical protein
MNVRMKLLQGLVEEMHADLSRPHPFAFERVGFLTCGIARADGDALVMLGSRWHSIADEDYIDKPDVGACIGPAAFRKILQYAYFEPVSIFHIHRHDHRGKPEFSGTDSASAREYVPGFFNACGTHPHGAIVVSLDNATGDLWMPGRRAPRRIDRFDVIGIPLRRWS